MLVPMSCKIKSVTHNTADVFTFSLASEKGGTTLPFLPGQFNMLYLFGFGEVPISISGHYGRDEGLIHTVRAVGKVTEGMQRLKTGDLLGLRGPFGTSWPLTADGNDVVFIAGGLGLPPLRAALYHFAENKKKVQKITLLYGARTPGDLLFPEDLEAWRALGVEVAITVDKADDQWKGDVGVVTRLIKEHLSNPEKTMVLMCGPEIMMEFALQELLSEPIPKDKIFVSLERNMQCAVGFCGHCQHGPNFVCKDGPVFGYDKIKKWWGIHEL